MGGVSRSTSRSLAESMSAAVSYQYLLFRSKLTHSCCIVLQLYKLEGLFEELCPGVSAKELDSRYKLSDK